MDREKGAGVERKPTAYERGTSRSWSCPCSQQLPSSRSKHPFSLGGSLSLAMEWPNQESLRGASEYFAALPMSTANLRAENNRACASGRGYTHPCPSVLTRLPLHSSQVACEYSFFVPSGLVWHPRCWKNSQEDTWWGGILLTLTTGEHREKIRGVSGGEAKGVLYLLRESGE